MSIRSLGNFPHNPDQAHHDEVRASFSGGRGCLWSKDKEDEILEGINRGLSYQDLIKEAKQSNPDRSAAAVASKVSKLYNQAKWKEDQAEDNSRDKNPSLKRPIARHFWKEEDLKTIQQVIRKGNDEGRSYQDVAQEIHRLYPSRAATSIGDKIREIKEKMGLSLPKESSKQRSENSTGDPNRIYFFWTLSEVNNLLEILKDGLSQNLTLSNIARKFKNQTNSSRNEGVIRRKINELVKDYQLDVSKAHHPRWTLDELNEVKRIVENTREAKRSNASIIEEIQKLYPHRSLDAIAKKVKWATTQIQVGD